MKCSQCAELTDPGAAYCGNCGCALQNKKFAYTASIKQQQQSVAGAFEGSATVPMYALGTKAQHRGETLAVLSIVGGVIGIIAAPFIIIVGFALGLSGVIVGTISRGHHRRIANLVGIVLSVIALCVSLASWTYFYTKVQHEKSAKSTAVSARKTAVAAAGNSVTTPCYEAGFPSQLNISTPAGTCDMQAYDGPTLGSSRVAYKVYGYSQPSLVDSNFLTFARTALEKDIEDNLPGFSIGKQSVGQFAGSTAYIVNAYNVRNGVAYVEAAVLHKSGKKNNIFVFVHATTGKTTNLSQIESKWQWH